MFSDYVDMSPASRGGGVGIPPPTSSRKNSHHSMSVKHVSSSPSQALTSHLNDSSAAGIPPPSRYYYTPRLYPTMQFSNLPDFLIQSRGSNFDQDPPQILINELGKWSDILRLQRLNITLWLTLHHTLKAAIEQSDVELQFGHYWRQRSSPWSFLGCR